MLIRLLIFQLLPASLIRVLLVLVFLLELCSRHCLFTIACGAISGFHSLVASGTTSKQLDKEKDALPIAYGGMLIECVLAIISVCAVWLYLE